MILLFLVADVPANRNTPGSKQNNIIYLLLFENNNLEQYFKLHLDFEENMLQTVIYSNLHKKILMLNVNQTVFMLHTKSVFLLPRVNFMESSRCKVGRY